MNVKIFVQVFTVTLLLIAKKKRLYLVFIVEAQLNILQDTDMMKSTVKVERKGETIMP